jgi:hypothetical protein
VSPDGTRACTLVSVITDRRRRLSIAGALLALAAIGAVAISSAAVPAATRSAPKKITPSGVGGVKLGRTYTSLRAASLLSKIGPGCELGGPNTRSARLRAPLKGAVDLSTTSPRKVTNITVTGGATASGVGVGATQAAVTFDHGTDSTFRLTVARVPKSGGGRLEFAIDTKTKRVTLIGIPHLAFCE